MKNSNNSRNKIRTLRGDKGETLRIVSKTLFLCLLLVIAAGAFGFGRWVNDVLADTPDLDTNRIFANVSTLIFDQDGELIIEEGIERREWVQFHEISQVMIDAILAIEDARFFDHYGVDWTRTMMAVRYSLESILTGSESLQGGSTLTQQLINRTHLLLEDGDRDTTVERKLQEILLAIQLERQFSKEQIIEAYLNFAPFGGRVFGVQAAAQFYFGVDASDLNLSQAATLAGLVQRPNVHRPDWNAIQAQIRRNEVLNLMVHHGFITPQLRDLAAAEPITDLLVYNEIDRSEITRYQPFINRVLDEAFQRFGINPMGGYRIYTTLDREAQGFVYDLLTTNAHFNWQDEAMQTAVSMIGNDGRIRALASRELLREDNLERGFNLAVDGRRQPGSASKPIWVYAPAMEYLDWGTGNMIMDELFGYGGGIDPRPIGGGIVRNWNVQYHGRVSVRNAMDWSWNVPAVKTMNAVTREHDTPETVMGFIESLGIPAYINQQGQRVLYESHAIGSHPVSTLQMAGAYAAFANGGTFTEPFTIERIVAPDGTILYNTAENHRSERVMSEATAYMITDTLRTTVTQGTGQWQVNVPNQWVAGKTGTTNFGDAERRELRVRPGGVPDVWFVGYSMDYTVAVWTGYESIRSGDYLIGGERNIAMQLFSIIMRELNTAGMRRPERPATVVERRVEWQSGSEDGEVCLPSSATPSSFTRLELFHSHAVPTCVSDVFTGGTAAAEEPEAPINFEAVSGGGTTINFTWESSIGTGGINTSMSLSQVEAARDRARGMTRGQSNITAALRDLSPGEGEAVMMIERIRAGARSGDMRYLVIGVLGNGTTTELTTTTSNYATVTLSRNQAATIQSFHVIARSSGGSSDPSNAQPNSGFIDPSELDIEIPNMADLDWTRNQAEMWANEEGISVTFTAEYSSTIQENLVIRTNPSGSIRADQTLRIVISRGPEPQLIPGMPIDPTDPTDDPVPPSTEETETPGSDPEVDPFNLNPGLSDVIHVGNFDHHENERAARLFAVVLERFRGIKF